MPHIVAVQDGYFRVICLVVAQNAAHIIAAGHRSLVAAVDDFVGRADGAADDTACVAAFGIRAGDDSLHHNAGDLRIVDGAEQACILGTCVQSLDRMAVTAEAAAERPVA